MLVAIGRRARELLRGRTPWSDVYGLARSLLALSTALTLAFNDVDVLFTSGAGVADAPFCGGIRGAGAFCLVPRDQLDVARWGLIAILALVASGWRPQITGVLHWWATWSLHVSALLVDGGDQLAATLSLLLLPISVTDGRRWHWSKSPWSTDARPYRAIIAATSLLALRVQVALVYFEAAVFKFSVAEWTEGTALYYWFSHPTYGAPDWMLPMLRPFLESPAVAALTWSVLVVEVALFMGLVVEARYRSYLLACGIALHTGIILIHGLVSFGLVMFAALILFLRPTEKPFGLGVLASHLRWRLRPLTLQNV